MRYAVNRTIQAEIPKQFIDKYERAIERGRMSKGIPEFNHPTDYWEVIDLRTGQRWSNYLQFKPKRKWIVVNKSLILAVTFNDYDFDRLPLPLTVVSHLLECDEWYWRYSTTCKGVHLLCKHDISDFDDQTRQRATEIRGYSWYWKNKDGHPAKSWQKGSRMQALIFASMGNRKTLRRKPPTHKKHKRRFYLK